MMSVWVIILPVIFWYAKGVDAALGAGPARIGRRGRFYGSYTLILGGLLVWTASASPVPGDGKIFLLFLGFLPLVNFLFDFASLGLTRYCLRRGLRPGFLNALQWSLIDALAAIALFAGLVMAAILVVHWVRDSNGTPLTTLNDIFTGIARDPHSYWWLYLTFFSTLVPTLLHLGVASFSFIALAPAPLQRRVAGWIGAMDRDGFANLGARAVLPLIVTLSIALPFLALYTLGLWIADYHGEVGRAFFRLALGFAGWLDPAYVAGVEAILSGS